MPTSPGLAERGIWLLSDLELCPGNTGLYISMGFGFLSLLLAVAGGIIAWTRYKMNVKVWLYSHGVTWFKEKDIDRDKRVRRLHLLQPQRSRRRHSGANRG
ncbi:hypothetical protein CEXT_769621 [Caerostris extrusa]|uniref:Uncharacterized protein n=1 Tax=Caerostris extrusa TaxID=172846 RepID=A0AAV4U3F0_CAEEX|nr:hypothetical protein CEXT_769621 [Caerostris extrusa]